MRVAARQTPCAGHPRKYLWPWPDSVTTWNLPGNPAFEKSCHNCSQLLCQCAAAGVDWCGLPPFRGLVAVIGVLEAKARPSPRLSAGTAFGKVGVRALNLITSLHGLAELERLIGCYWEGGALSSSFFWLKLRLGLFNLQLENQA